ncbi:LLM class flavin-dependent oxidoreductase [Brevundimonas sp.]|uniref:LLM class flavin-dependent oxidoreductase n=1 Tax=Brevundimonas sp. TaxID=1871086 RepID=UPI003BAA5B27
MLKLSVFMSPTGGHVAGWRLPDASIDAGLRFEPWVEFAQLAERGKFDMLFLADGNGVNGITTPDLLSRNPTLRPSVFEPITLLSALATHTKHIGLVATATTTYDEPYSIARRYGSLDRLSNGRAGWNVVTSSNPEDALNFSHDSHAGWSERYERAAEFIDVTRGLWDSWADDAFVLNKESGQFLDASRVKLLEHKGKNFSVRGPLNMARPPQGHPVVVLAGGSESAKELAARSADVVFTVNETKEEAQAFYADVKGRLAKYGRSPESLVVLPGAAVFTGATTAEAEALYSELQDLIPEEIGVALLSKLLSFDLSGYPIDGPIPKIEGEVSGITAFRDMLIRNSERDGLSIRQTYQKVLPARGHFVIIGDAAHVADQMQDWYESKACDGFNVIAPYLPGGLAAFVDHVVPELQNRGLFRREYEGETLRDSLGLAHVPNARFDTARQDS